MAKQTAIECGLPVVPGSQGALKSLEDALDVAEKIGYPIMLKAAAGGGGRGMRPVMCADEMSEAYNLTKNEAKSAFGDDTLYMENGQIKGELPQVERNADYKSCGKSQLGSPKNIN